MLTDRTTEIVGRYVERRVDDKPLPYLFTTHGGVPVRTETVSALITGISAVMEKDKAARASFELRDLRRTCETMLAAMNISKDHWVQIQSHGLGGVQDHHYDGHEYMEEKRTALDRWAARLEETKSGKPKANVVSMTRRKA